MITNWPGRVIGGMCFVILYPANEILDPEADTLELHPQWVKRDSADGVAVVDALPEDHLGLEVPQFAGDAEEIAWLRAEIVRLKTAAGVDTVDGGER